MPRSCHFSLSGILLATSLLCPVAVLAQEQAADTDDAMTLGTIVLQAINDGGAGVNTTEAANTAGSRVPVNPENLPRSVTVLPRELFEAQGARTLEETAAYSPGITTESYGQDDRYDEFTLRGFEAQTTSIYRDGMPLRTIDWAAWRTEPFGLESVNILRGPTSDLYGANRPGGLINAVTKRPKFTFGGEIRAALTNEEGREIGIDITGPVSDKVALRFVGLFNESGTIYDEVDTGRVYLAPSVTFAPTDDTTLTFYAQYQKDDVGDSYVLVPRFGSLQPNANGVFGPGTYTGNPNYNDIRTTQRYVGYELDHRLTESWRVMSRARVSENDWVNQTEYPAAFVNLSYVLGAPRGLPNDIDTAIMTRFNVDQEMTQITLDNALVYEFDTASARGHLAFGVDHFELESDTDFSFGYAGERNLLNGFVTNFLAGAVPAFLPNRRETDLDQTGFYINGHAELGRDFILSGGLRYDQVDYRTKGFSTGLTGIQGFNNRVDDAFTSGNIALGYKITPELMAYGSAGRGFNLPPSGLKADLSGLDVETSQSYELGMKYLSGDGATAVNVALFHIERQDVAFDDPASGNPLVFSQVGEARSRGVELEVTHDFQNGLSLFASASYANAKVTKDPNFAGNRLARAPKVAAALFAQYEFANVPGLAVSAGARFTGKRYADIANSVNIGAATLIDASISYERDDWEVLLAGRNLADKQQVSFCGSSQLPLGSPILDSVSGSCVYSAGREISLTLRRNF